MIKPEVSVIVAARNAAETIPRAVRSALNEPEVVQVLVVDDASSDGTSRAAWSADDASGRLSVHRLNVNRGPAGVRNLAIDRTNAPFIAILDADDCFLEGRFRSIFSDTEWDLAADNIMFVEERPGVRVSELRSPGFEESQRYLSLEEFVIGNISRRGEHRGELGFLKPVIRREFLERCGLRYDEAMRLGEDYDLYVRAMRHGARFKITEACGYLAVVRPDSLSGRHRTEDLQKLADADLALLATGELHEGSRRALARHERHVRDKYRLRRFLDIKSEDGTARALAYAFSSGPNIAAVCRGVLGDKLDDVGRYLAPERAAGRNPPVRFLMPVRSLARDD